jgi:hypothetical protein
MATNALIVGKALQSIRQTKHRLLTVRPCESCPSDEGERKFASCILLKNNQLTETALIVRAEFLSKVHVEDLHWTDGDQPCSVSDTFFRHVYYIYTQVFVSVF